MNRYKLIGFDMDGTLCHPAKPFDEIFEQAFGFKIETVADVWMQAVMAEGARTGVKAISAILPRLNSLEAQEFLLKFSDIWAQEQQLFKGVFPMLQRLRTNGIKLTLITNGPSTMQHAVIDHLGIRTCFDHVFTTGDKILGVNKPDPKCFAKVANYFDIDPQDCLFIGDGKVNDYKGALGAGWDALWVAPNDRTDAQKFSNLLITADQSKPHNVKWL